MSPDARYRVCLKVGGDETEGMFYAKQTNSRGYLNEK